MPTRRFRPLLAADLDLLPEPCASCTFWESGLIDLAYPADHQDRSGAKREWAETVTRRWGHCGVLALNDREVIGYLTMAPSVHVPRLGAFATTPVSADAAVLMTVRVVPEHRNRGIGRQLVQSAAALLARRDIRALEAVGTLHPAPSCMLSTAWLESVGFAVVRQHPVTPRLRMDLQTTARWPNLGAAWNRLTDLVATPAAPAPEAASFRPTAR